jgi:hypothetical protein
MDAFGSKALDCQITNEPVFDGMITTDDCVVERSLVAEYETLALRRTRTFEFTATESGTAPHDRLSVYS